MENIKKYVKSNLRKVVSVFVIIILVISFILVNYFDFFNVHGNNFQNKIDDMDIAIGGETVGIKLLATGVLVMSLDRDDTNLQIADVILKVDDIKIETNLELQNITKNSNGKILNLEVSRKDKIFNTQILPIYDELSKEYRLGLWVKDSSAGVGTITFYDRKKLKFAALGHAVTETKENYILPITSGGITSTDIYSIKKGISKVPGELKGTISSNIIGEIVHNTGKGIYGKMYSNEYFKNKEKISVVSKSEIKEGVAYIISSLDDKEAKQYEIQIEKILLNSSGNKNMIIKVTDETLISKTGGIVQRNEW